MDNAARLARVLPSFVRLGGMIVFDGPADPPVTAGWLRIAAHAGESTHRNSVPQDTPDHVVVGLVATAVEDVVEQQHRRAGVR